MMNRVKVIGEKNVSMACPSQVCPLRETPSPRNDDREFRLTSTLCSAIMQMRAMFSSWTTCRRDVPPAADTAGDAGALGDLDGLDNKAQTILL